MSHISSTSRRPARRGPVKLARKPVYPGDLPRYVVSGTGIYDHRMSRFLATNVLPDDAALIAKALNYHNHGTGSFIGVMSEDAVEA